jgi:hypothetical protein
MQILIHAMRLFMLSSRAAPRPLLSGREERLFPDFS